MKSIIFMLLATMVLIGEACKKDSPLNPACNEDKLVPAYIYGSNCEYGMVRLVDENGNFNTNFVWDGEIKWKEIPKKYRLLAEDSLHVLINYKEHIASGCFTDIDPCTPCTTFTIKCIKLK